MVEFREDTIVYPSMVKLVACLCQEIADSGLPTPCLCAAVPGPMAVLEACGQCEGGQCGGQAWVRLTSALQSSSFPDASQLPSGCAAPLMWEFEVGIARCAPRGTSSSVRGYVGPTMEDYLAAVRLQTADMQAMRRAITCCFADGTYTYRLGAYAPLSVTGDCEGGVWTVQVWEIGD